MSTFVGSASLSVVDRQDVSAVKYSDASTVHESAPYNEETSASKLKVSLAKPNEMKGEDDLSIDVLLRKILQELRENAISQRDIQSESMLQHQKEKVSESRNLASFKIGPAVLAGLKLAVTAFSSGQSLLGKAESIGAKVSQISSSATEPLVGIINSALQYHEGLSQAKVQEQEYAVAGDQRGVEKSQEFARKCEENLVEMIKLIMDRSNSDVRAFQAAASV